MAYYLSDPYYFLPKCYPFLGKQWTGPPLQTQNRLTKIGKQVQDSCAKERLNFIANSYCDRNRCEQALLRCKLKAQEAQNSQNMAHVLSNRKGKEMCLRENSQKFPSFVRNQSLIERYKKESKR